VVTIGFQKDDVVTLNSSKNNLKIINRKSISTEDPYANKKNYIRMREALMSYRLR
jgi:hypothetical protein